MKMPKYNLLLKPTLHSSLTRIRKHVSEKVLLLRIRQLNFESTRNNLFCKDFFSR